ncbi:MAG: type II toxin-antitoxin system RelB/DinJ family antitoxin [Pseudobutyrivibrio sp.]|nr:type II toxin-antitoxin system RelB/DinJ family antitoxin [Pseudobutyrivibrio sp.]
MSKQTEVITFELDEEAEREVKEVLDELGMDMDTAINLLFKEIIRTRTMPVEISALKEER